MTESIQLTLGPLLFNWAPDRIRDDAEARVRMEALSDGSLGPDEAGWLLGWLEGRMEARAGGG